MRLEFNRKSGSSNTVSEKVFAELLIAYAGFAEKKKSKMIRRVKKTFKSEERGVTLEDYLNFYQVSSYQFRVISKHFVLQFADLLFS